MRHLLITIALAVASTAGAYENTCTTDNLSLCAARPCVYVPGYTGACDAPYITRHDPAARGHETRSAICQANNGFTARYTGPRHIPGIGPACPVTWVKIR